MRSAGRRSLALSLRELETSRVSSWLFRARCVRIVCPGTVPADVKRTQATGRRSFRRTARPRAATATRRSADARGRRLDESGTPEESSRPCVFRVRYLFHDREVRLWGGNENDASFELSSCSRQTLASTHSLQTRPRILVGRRRLVGRRLGVRAVLESLRARASLDGHVFRASGIELFDRVLRTFKSPNRTVSPAEDES